MPKFIAAAASLGGVAAGAPFMAWSPLSQGQIEAITLGFSTAGGSSPPDVQVSVGLNRVVTVTGGFTKNPSRAEPNTGGGVWAALSWGAVTLAGVSAVDDRLWTVHARQTVRRTFAAPIQVVAGPSTFLAFMNRGATLPPNLSLLVSVEWWE